MTQLNVSSAASLRASGTTRSGATLWRSRAAREFDVDIVLENAEKKPLKVFGSSCRRADFASRVEQQGKLVGWVRICGRHGHPRGFTFVLVLGAAGLTLWAASGFIARRLVRPFGELVRVTEEIGAGNLAARTQLDRRRAAEVGVVGEAINHMADRIERQIADQRELLAGVSHELRSPLARVRLLLELGRAGKVPVETLAKLDEIETEIVEIDELVGELLASSRLDFAALEPKPLDVRELAARALERANLPAELLQVRLDDSSLLADPTLILTSARKPARQRSPARRRPDAARSFGRRHRGRVRGRGSGPGVRRRGSAARVRVVRTPRAAGRKLRFARPRLGAGPAHCAGASGPCLGRKSRGGRRSGRHAGVTRKRRGLVSDARWVRSKKQYAFVFCHGARLFIERR